MRALASRSVAVRDAVALPKPPPLAVWLMARVPLASGIAVSEPARRVTVWAVFQLAVVKVSVLSDGLLTVMSLSLWGAVAPSAMVTVTSAVGGLLSLTV